MANDNFFKGFDPANMPSLDLSHTISLASGIQAQIDESPRSNISFVYNITLYCLFFHYLLLRVKLARSTLTGHVADSKI